MTTKTVTLEVAEFILAQEFKMLSPDLIGRAKECVLDGLGVMLAGSTTEPGQVLRKYLKEVGSVGKAKVWGSDIATQSHLAALANGTSGHAMDYDDTQLSSSPDRVYGLLTHPTVPVLAASLAVGQEVGATGGKVLAAFCTGFEVECKIAEAINPRHYQQGFHSTGTLGVFGAVASSALLMGLSLEQIRNALGIAASKSAGIRVNFGTMTKPYHAGAAAENGVIAARLAKLGYQADPDALDGPWGFFQVAAGGCEPERVRGRLGNPWSMLEPGVSVKPYPCGSLAHPAMDALLELITAHDIKPQEVEEVRLGTSSHVLAALRYQSPRNHLEAKFSIPFCLGILVMDRKAGIEQFRDEVLQRQDVQDMMGRVNSYLHQGIEAQGYDHIRSLVEVKLKDGRLVSREADTSRGMPQRPMTPEELREKFLDCARGVLREDQADKAIEAIHQLEGFKDINDFADFLA